ncbi:MoaD/ThiS family protein [Actinomycetospora endophytica]|uniref:MoaD/ThiS family protein n=1 Tax=Actinomycetospora endophytica TaxID=2291215 RepID=A0ABS8PJ26_9PSEU|nr:MoaD/ThiS family protein [Actinomycetospora endophytica]MCD2198265.1 MoaD/ThiS family protein [Actinomycetospora endophytica]
MRYFGGAKAAAGTPSERVALAPGTSVDDLVATLTATHGDALARVLAASSFLLDKVAVHERSVAVDDGAVLDVLPPSAGG